MKARAFYEVSFELGEAGDYPEGIQSRKEAAERDAVDGVRITSDDFEVISSLVRVDLGGDEPFTREIY